MFERRPIWSRNAVKANINIQPDKLKLLLPILAYYMVSTENAVLTVEMLQKIACEQQILCLPNVHCSVKDDRRFCSAAVKSRGDISPCVYFISLILTWRQVISASLSLFLGLLMCFFPCVCFKNFLWRTCQIDVAFARNRADDETKSACLKS